MRLPDKIENCPIADSIVEIRFTTDVHPKAVFGIVYNSLMFEFPKVDTLPIMQLPDPIVANEPSLKFKPHYKLSAGDGFGFQVGPDVLVFGVNTPYPGWSVFLPKIQSVIEKLKPLDVIKNVLRIGLRYVNLFSSDIFENINLQVTQNNNSVQSNSTQLRIESTVNEFTQSVSIANQSVFVNANGRFYGSSVDIDVFKAFDQYSFDLDIVQKIEAAHQIEKETFFNLLKPEFLTTLSPIYK